MLLPAKFALSLAVLAAGSLAGQDNEDLGSVLAGNEDLTQFYGLIKIVAPSDKAMANIAYTALQPLWDPEDRDKTMPILQYHILGGAVSVAALKVGPTYLETSRLTSPALTNVTAGQGVLVSKQRDAVVLTSGQGARCSVVQADIPFAGGLVQVVDNLLVPPTRVAAMADAFRLTSCLGSLHAARMMPDAADRKNVTILAPHDDAYSIVGGTLRRLDARALARVMGYHIIPGQVLSLARLADGSRHATLAVGARVAVRQHANSKFVDAARIVQPDILIANGVMHIIGSVLNPDAAADAAVPDPRLATQAPVFAVSTVSGVFASALPCTADCPASTTASGSAGGGGPSEAAPATTTSATATAGPSLRSRTSHAAAPRCTAHLVVAAVGMVGLGAGVAWM
ncbi:beta-Ig-H3/Fasciclin [Metarhizium album ARSEF 1941]|uniref:Beta-Ig-H3/Fasciclin n=1 Tax=Metarhizium album (strain ARSEF 1941) TaxID=1081103 RepID=A0A0B2X480_METAS|nr:beta-Ig-H3/Fasciclin [Metarhizium album ARSEF 1941]KHO00225.1 beta-Ig-H3/Fasciclin [Metarhizium album ARSEF 1941]